MWGWTALETLIPYSSVVNPTYVGMDRDTPPLSGKGRSKPHVCGDGPLGYAADWGTFT